MTPDDEGGAEVGSGLNVTSMRDFSSFFEMVGRGGGDDGGGGVIVEGSGEEGSIFGRSAAISSNVNASSSF